jgi:hypothetical protein
MTRAEKKAERIRLDLIKYAGFGGKCKMVFEDLVCIGGVLAWCYMATRPGKHTTHVFPGIRDMHKL